MKKQSTADKVFNKLLETYEEELNRDDNVIIRGNVRITKIDGVADFRFDALTHESLFELLNSEIREK